MEILKRGIEMHDNYLNVRKLPKIISKEETTYLFNNFNKENRQKLINSNLKLVANEVIIVFKIEYNKQLEFFQIGVEGLINAVDHFDITKGTAFTTYAKKCIDNKIISSLKLEKNKTEMYSLSEPIVTYDNNKELLLNDIITGDDNFTDDIDNKFLINYLLNKLSERNRKIIILYFGLYNNSTYTEKELAKMFNTTKSNISYVIVKSLKKFKDIINKEDRQIKRNTKTII